MPGWVDLLNSIFQVLNGGAKRAFEGFTTGFIEDFGDITHNFNSIDAESAKLAKSIGMGRSAMDQMSRRTLQAVSELNISRKYNISTEELIQAQRAYAEALERNTRIAVGQYDAQGNLIEGTGNAENLAAMQNIMGQSATDMLKNMDLFGISIDGASKTAGRMYSTAAKTGISFQKYSQNMLNNFKIANNYNFKNGLRGLESMAKKATEMKIDMQQAVNFAEKVGTVEGSISTAANLQVLGGNFANFADPMQMLYESLNDMESVQDRMANMFKGLGALNKETGEIEISAFNRQRVKAAAQAMGMSQDEAMTMIRTNARREEIGTQLSSIVGGNEIGDQTRELLQNIATFKNGHAVVSIGGEERSLTEVVNDKELQEQLLEENRSESDDIKIIADRMKSMPEIIEGAIKAARAGFAVAEVGSTKVGEMAGINSNVQVIKDIFQSDIFDPKILGELEGSLTNISVLVNSQLISGFNELGRALSDLLPSIFSSHINGDEGTEGIMLWLEELWKKIDAWDKGENEAIHRLFNGSDNFYDMYKGNQFSVDETHATGGIIGGRRHSEGGTIIEAEKGEFVVNRNAMNEYGPLVEAINRRGNMGKISGTKFENGGYPEGKYGNNSFGAERITIDLNPFGTLQTDIKTLADVIGNNGNMNFALPQIRSGNEIKSANITQRGISQVSDNGIHTIKVVVDEREKKTVNKSAEPKEVTFTIKMEHSPIIVKNENGAAVDIEKYINTPSFIRNFAKEIQEAIGTITKGGKIMETLS